MFHKSNKAYQLGTESANRLKENETDVKSSLKSARRIPGEILERLTLCERFQSIIMYSTRKSQTHTHWRRDVAKPYGLNGFSNSGLSWHAGQVSTRSELSRCFTDGCVCVCVEGRNMWRVYALGGCEQHNCVHAHMFKCVHVHSHLFMQASVCLCMHSHCLCLCIKHYA